MKLKRLIEQIMRENAPVKITDGMDVWYLAKGEDSTHFEMVNDPKYIGKFGPDKHIGQFRNRPWYDDVRSWLKGGPSPNNKTY